LRLAGFIIIDPATGAMYKLETPAVNAGISEYTSTSSVDGERSLKIGNINHLPKRMLTDLKLVVEGFRRYREKRDFFLGL
jgi:hypothetical protein